MKGLTEYLIEQMQEIVNESNEKWYRFTTNEFEDQSIIDNVKQIASSAGFYVENIDNGIKIRVDLDKRTKLAGIADFLQTKVDGIKDDENKEEICKKIEDIINQMRNDVSDADKEAAEAAEKKAKEQSETEETK